MYFPSIKKQMLGILLLMLYLLKKLYEFLSSLNLGRHVQLKRNDLGTSVS